MDTILTTLRDHYADFDGRARRKESWLFQLAYYAYLFVGGGLWVGLMEISETLGWVVFAVLVLGGLALIPPGLAVTIRRLHDTGRSGWFFLFGLIPYIGGLILFYFTVLPGDEGMNDYGPDPKDPFGTEEPRLEDFARVLGD